MGVSDVVLSATVSLAEDMLAAFRAALMAHGIKEDSLIYNDASYKVSKSDGSFVVDFLVPYYVAYIESGRRPKATKVPVEALVKWAASKGIPTDNNTIYAIRESIYQRGIAPRPVWSETLAEFDVLVDNYKKELADGLAPVIRAQLVP